MGPHNLSRRDLISRSIAAGAALSILPRLTTASPESSGDSPAGGDWAGLAPRDEIRPGFGVEAGKGPGGSTVLTIKADERRGLDGYWQKSFPVVGARSYRFSALYQTSGTLNARRSI